MNSKSIILMLCGWVVLLFIGCKPEPEQNDSKKPIQPEISDSVLLNTVQRASMDYMWSGADPTSGLAYERIHTDNNYGYNDPKIITIGGSGFGIAGLVVAMERGFISRQQGVERLQKIVTFLAKADRFHGVWPHWMKPDGKVYPFSTNDNGGDLVESSFLMEGLLIARQYLDPNVASEKAVVDGINELYETMEFDWYRNNQNCLYWHWSPNKEWIMNMPVRGWNEALIVYVLAAASPTHTISKEVYTKGWGANNRPTSTYSKPLFWTHYSFIGLNPMNIKDTYADYREVVINHALTQVSYCTRNPKQHKSYSAQCWGLTAGYSPEGYAAHCIDDDRGVITMTAALSSMPYTPKQSMDALRYFYSRKDELWGIYGFYDGFCDSKNWCPPHYLAIDQLTIAPMIENYRSGLLWNLFMSCPEIQKGLTKLGFTY
ncbi:MAG: beta-glucosidase [Paludibacteraceae bacterium]|nr:beta-glucosidase [Paludibacteraceae bacterium]